MTTTRTTDFSVGNTSELFSIDKWRTTTEYVGAGESTTDYYDYNNYLDEIVQATCDYWKPATYYLPALYSLLFILGLSGNVLVVWVIVAGVRLRSMTDVCLLNLAIADLLLISSLPFLAHQARDRWSFGDAMCKVVLGTYHVGYYSGIFFITLMSIDRYLAIVHAIFARKMRTRSFGVLAAVVTWVAGLLASFPEVGFLQAQGNNETMYCAPSYEKMDNSSNWWRAFGLLKMNILGLAIPLVIMIFCYCQIVGTLLSSQTSKKQAIRLIAVVVSVFLCCWLPYNVTCFFHALELMDIYTSCNHSRHIRMVLQVTEVIAYSHSCINPMLYVFVGERFRRQLLKLISRCPCSLWPVVRRCIPSQDRLRGSMYSQSTSLNERSTVM